MNSPVKTRLLVWLVLLLFVMNAATIVSLVIHARNTSRQETVQQPEERLSAQSEKGARFFRDYLNLNPKQTLRFREINREYNRATHRIAADLEMLRVEMVELMGNAHPDTIRLYAICHEIGLNHEKMKKLTVGYYLGMKESCNAEQQVKLNTLFLERVQKEDPAGSSQGRRGYRRRGGRE